MPSRNIARLDEDDHYYHVYSRGINKEPVFLEPGDKEYMLHLLSRHLSEKPYASTAGYLYPYYRGKVELLSFCFMDNHFHFLFYQRDKGCISELMQSLLTAYTAYFNRKHARRGPLFESRYKSSPIIKDAYLHHISRYIHLNPRYWKTYPYSSYVYIRKAKEPVWLQPGKVLELFNDNRDEYKSFIEDYEEYKKLLDEIKHELADN
jgi:REP element-mobilizing transposase RayT